MQDIIPANLHERNPKDFKSTKPQMVAKLSKRVISMNISYHKEWGQYS